MPYNPNFLREVTIKLPKIDRDIHPNVVRHIKNVEKKVLDYTHHSVVLNKDRRLAIISACNIDGSLIPKNKIPRKGDFRDNAEILATDQLGKSFYDQCGSIIDRGHLTKFEDVIWGKNMKIKEYTALGGTTNFYPNAVPQHRRLNRGKWSSLELYILDTETEKNELKVCMFTGPVLNDNDPAFLYTLDGKTIQLPVHFWKIVMYKKNSKVYALGFMMSHKTLLGKTKLVREMPTRSLTESDPIYFTDYKHSQPYQVMVEQIEELAGIKLQSSKKIIKPYKDPRPLETITREIDVRSIIAKEGLLTNMQFINLVTG
jgi:endonuclease G, mitochondrial